MGGLGDISGVDTEGRQFASVAELWEHELKDRDEQAASQPKSSAGTGKKWYSNALTYWTSVEPSKYGVMGGQVGEVMSTSRRRGGKRARLDCGMN